MLYFDAKILNKMLKSLDFKNSSNSALISSIRNMKYATPPKSFYKKYTIDEFCALGRSCYTLSLAKKTDIHILFFHGGGYRAQAELFHWQFARRLMSSFDCSITFADYPLIPEHTCVETVDMAVEAYKKLLAQNNERKIVLMGDSAGAGLALSLAQQIKIRNVSPKPHKVVLLSPWLDVSMTSEIPAALDASDMMLNIDYLIENGKIYAGESGVKNPLCSPIYGDIKDIGDIALFIGTHDILYIDSLKFKKKSENDGVRLAFYEYEDMPHDFVIFPVEQARQATEQIKDFILAP